MSMGFFLFTGGADRSTRKGIASRIAGRVPSGKCIILVQGIRHPAYPCLVLLTF